MSDTEPHFNTRRRTLAPRDYLANPPAFGRDEAVGPAVALPPGGDAISCRLALAQHRQACRWRAARQRRSPESLAAEFGFGSSTWWATVNGHRWFNGATGAAMAQEMLRLGPA